MTASTYSKSMPWYRTLRGREAISFYLFILPWIVGFVIFTLGPIIASVGPVSYTHLDVYKRQIPNSHTNGNPPDAFFANRFQSAWSNAPATTRLRAAEFMADQMTPNVQAQGRCAALSRSVPWSAELGY